MSEKLQSLPRSALAVEFVGAVVKLAKGLALPLIAALLVEETMSWFELVAVAALPVAFVYSLISHRRFRYGVEGDRLIVHSGVLSRTRRSLPIARIHSVSLRTTPVHKLFGLVSVEIESAGASGADAELPAVTPAEASRLRELFSAGATPEAAGATEGPAREVLWRGTTAQVLLHGATDTRILIALGGLGAFLVGGGDDLVRPWLRGIDLHPWAALSAMAGGRLGAYLETLLLQLAVLSLAAGLVLFALGWLVSIGHSLLVYGRFLATNGPSGLVLSHGLWVERERQIPRRRLQMLIVERPLLRRLFGFGSIFAETAGDAASDSAAGRLLVAPMVPDRALAEVAARFHLAAALEGVSWSPVHRKTLERRLWRALTLFAALALLATLARSLAVAGLAASIATVDAGRSILDYRYTRYSVEPDRLLFRTGALWRKLWMVPLDKVQSVELLQGPLARSRDLAALRIETAGSELRSHVTVRFLRTRDAINLAERLSARSAAGAGDGV